MPSCSCSACTSRPLVVLRGRGRPRCRLAAQPSSLHPHAARAAGSSRLIAPAAAAWAWGGQQSLPYLPLQPPYLAARLPPAACSCCRASRRRWRLAQLVAAAQGLAVAAPMSHSLQPPGAAWQRAARASQLQPLARASNRGSNQPQLGPVRLSLLFKLITRWSPVAQWRTGRGRQAQVAIFELGGPSRRFKRWATARLCSCPCMCFKQPGVVEGAQLVVQHARQRARRSSGCCTLQQREARVATQGSGRLKCICVTQKDRQDMCDHMCESIKGECRAVWGMRPMRWCRACTAGPTRQVRCIDVAIAKSSDGSCRTRSSSAMTKPRHAADTARGAGGARAQQPAVQHNIGGAAARACRFSEQVEPSQTVSVNKTCAKGSRKHAATAPAAQRGTRQQFTARQQANRTVRASVQPQSAASKAVCLTHVQQQHAPVCAAASRRGVGRAS